MLSPDIHRGGPWRARTFTSRSSSRSIRKASWSLVEALDGRQEALDLAHRLKGRPVKGSVRVAREQWIPEESAFRGGVIFESGSERFVEAREKTAEAEPALPDAG